MLFLDDKKNIKFQCILTYLKALDHMFSYKRISNIHGLPDRPYECWEWYRVLQEAHSFDSTCVIIYSIPREVISKLLLVLNSLNHSIKISSAPFLVTFLTFSILMLKIHNYFSRITELSICLHEHHGELVKSVDLITFQGSWSVIFIITVLSFS